MKAKGIVRKVDNLGRVVLPREMLKAAGMFAGTPVEILQREDGSILLTPQPVGCEMGHCICGMACDEGWGYCPKCGRYIKETPAAGTAEES